MAHHCAQCGELATAKCGDCRVVAYCGQECQRDDWNSSHAETCFDLAAAIEQQLDSHPMPEIGQELLDAGLEDPEDIQLAVEWIGLPSLSGLRDEFSRRFQKGKARRKAAKLGRKELKLRADRAAETARADAYNKTSVV
jgi:MYND finger